MSKKHEFVWDGRGERGDDARFSVLPGPAASDLRLTCIHFRILAHLGRFNNRKGWCRLNQTELATMFAVRRQAVNKAVGELTTWRYIATRSQEETGESFCLYRTIIDHAEAAGVSATPDTPPPQGVSATPDTSVRSRRTPVSPRKDTQDQSIDHVEDQRSSEISLDDSKSRPAALPRFVSEAALERVRGLAPGWDRQALLRKFLDWPGSKNARNMDAAFIAWVPSFTKGKQP